jgi:hypothetical protein
MGAREFLQRFWQNRSLAGGDLEISSYRGLGLISSSDPKAPLATALINDQLVLLASQREALEDALDSSQVDALNQANDPQLQGWLQQQRKGVALLRSDATGISELLGLPAQLVAAEQLEELVGSIALKGRGLQVKRLQGILEGAYVDAHCRPSRVLAEDVLVLEPVFRLGADADEAHEHEDVGRLKVKLGPDQARADHLPVRAHQKTCDNVRKIKKALSQNHKLWIRNSSSNSVKFMLPRVRNRL